MKGHLIVLVAALAGGCDDGAGPASEPDVATDARPPPPPPDAFFEADASAADAAVDRADAAPEPACTFDADCGERAYCDEAGRCLPAVDGPFVAPSEDGVTRAGAAPFDITPPEMERWEDRAGPECPENRPGRFDGRVDRPEPEDPCVDRFDDTNGDGLFRAVWLGGGGPDRPARAVDNENPPAGRVLVFARDELLYLLVTLDVAAVDAARLRTLTSALRDRLGLPEERIAVHATGSRSGPDAVGLAGPSLPLTPLGGALAARIGQELPLLSSLPAESGTDEAWWAEVARRCAAAARLAGSRLVPVRIRVSSAPLPGEEVDWEGGPLTLDLDGDGAANRTADLAGFRDREALLARDSAIPPHVDRDLRVLALDAITGGPVAVLLSWSAVPAAAPVGDPVLGADYPGVARAAVEAALPGAVAVWLTGAGPATYVAGGGALVPELDPNGAPVDEGGAPVDDWLLAAPSVTPVKSLGRLLAAQALAALDDGESAEAELAVSARFAWVPLESPRLQLAARLGLMPPLERWLSGRAASDAWSSGANAPACGGLGCVRYRLDRVALGPVTLLTVPGKVDGAYVSGRAAGEVDYADERNLRDLDGDGQADADDDEIRVVARGAERETVVTVPGPANPQRLPGVVGLGGGSWVVGGTGGGVGTFRSAVPQVNVFEGVLGPLESYVGAPENAAIVPCAHWACVGGGTLGELVAAVAASQPTVLADIPGAHELWVMGGTFEEAPAPQPFLIRDPDGEPRVEGEDLVLGPGSRAFTPSVDLVASGVRRGDALEVAGEVLLVGGVVPVELRTHPNAADAWESEAPRGGDHVYNAACELAFDGVCPHPQAVAGPDPNESLPRTP